jgi:glycogen(starch) synthase
MADPGRTPAIDLPRPEAPGTEFPEPTSGRRNAPQPSAPGRPIPQPARRPSYPAVASPPATARREALEGLSQDLTWHRTPDRPRPPERMPLRPLHVVMVGWEFPPFHSGGLGVHCYEITRELTAAGHRVTFLTPFPGPFEPGSGAEFRSPYEPRRLGFTPTEAYAPGSEFWSGAGVPSVEQYNEWVAALPDPGHVDVVHVHDWFGTAGGAALARRLGVPLVMTVHSTEYDRSLGQPTAEILRRETYGIQTADRVIAVSRHLKQQIAERYAASPDKVRVIYNAVRPPTRADRKLAPTQPMVLYLGRLAAMKGIETFLRAAARVAPIAPRALFVVAGDGPEYPRLLTLAAHLGIADRVLFLGRVSEEERESLLTRATIFILPSVVEPFGIAALEAMAAGVPTILSKTSGVAEVTENVFTVDFWDIDEFASRIAEILAYPALRQTMGALGREDATRHGWSERAWETTGVYRELLARRSGRHS